MDSIGNNGELNCEDLGLWGELFFEAEVPSTADSHTHRPPNFKKIGPRVQIYEAQKKVPILHYFQRRGKCSSSLWVEAKIPVLPVNILCTSTSLNSLEGILV